MPGSLVAEIGQHERNRSRFIAEAVRHELARRRHKALLLSLEHPHSQSRHFESANQPCLCPDQDEIWDPWPPLDIRA